MQSTLLRKWAGLRSQSSVSIQGFDLPARSWRTILLCLGFVVALVLLVVTGTIGPLPLMVAAVPGALALAIPAIFRPSLSLFLVFVGAGLPTLLLPVPGHTVRPVEVALLLCVLAVLVQPSPIRLRLPHLLALLFIAIALISFIHVPTVSTDPNAYAADKRLYAWFLILVALFCGTFLVKYVKNPSSFLVLILLSNIPLYLICLAQVEHVHLSPLLLAAVQDPTQKGRLWGPFAGAATLGLYAINLFCVALACWLLGTRKRDRVIGAVMTGITALILIGSGTRSSAIAAGVVVVLSFLFTRRFKLLLGSLLLTGAGVIIFANKIIPLFIHPEASTDNRIFLWQEALKLIAANPVIGIGMQQFYVYYNQLIVSQAAQLNARGISVHNQYLEWAMESGILWFIVGTVLLVSILYVCWKGYRRAPQGPRALLLATGMAVLANIIGAFVDVPLDKPEGAIFLFLLVGLALGYIEQFRWGNQHFKRSVVPSLPFIESRIPPAPPTFKNQSPLVPRSQRNGTPRPTQPLPSDVPKNASDDSAPNTQKTGRTVIIQLLSWGIAIPIIFPTTALLTRYLGPVQYGEYTFALPYLSIFALISGIGMDALVIRQLSRQPRKKWRDTLSYAVGTRLFFTILGIAASMLVALVLPVSSEERNLLLVGSLSLLFSFSVNGLRMVFSHGFRSEQRISSLALIETTNRIITAGLIVLVVLLRFSLWWVYIIIVYSDVPFFILQVWIARRRYGLRVRFGWKQAREQLFGGLPLLSYNIMVLIGNQADVFFLMMLAGPLSVGIYALAMRVTDPLLSIVVAYVVGLYPLLCRKFDEGRKQFALLYHESTRILALAIIPLAVFATAEADKIVSLLGGQSFTSAAIAVQLLMWAMAATFFGQLAVRACMAANKERQIPYVTLVSVSVNIALNLVLIPRWNIAGAGIAALSSEFTALCLFSFMLRRNVHLLSTIWVMLRVFLGNLPALAFLLWQQRFPFIPPPLAAAMLLVLLVGGCVATRTLSLKDARMVQHILFSRSAKKPSEGAPGQPTVALPSFTEWETAILPRVDDVSDRPTLILPRIEI
jgi:O-antigen/teichoic acid export membrane protein/O-antigen ligase